MAKQNKILNSVPDTVDLGRDSTHANLNKEAVIVATSQHHDLKQAHIHYRERWTDDKGNIIKQSPDVKILTIENTFDENGKSNGAFDKFEKKAFPGLFDACLDKLIDKYNNE